MKIRYFTLILVLCSCGKAMDDDEFLASLSGHRPELAPVAVIWNTAFAHGNQELRKFVTTTHTIRYGWLQLLPDGKVRANHSELAPCDESLGGTWSWSGDRIQVRMHGTRWVESEPSDHPMGCGRQVKYTLQETISDFKLIQIPNRTVPALVAKNRKGEVHELGLAPDGEVSYTEMLGHNLYSVEKKSGKSAGKAPVTTPDTPGLDEYSESKF